MTGNRPFLATALSCALGCALFGSVSVYAEAPPYPMGGMAEQLAKLGGQMHVAAKNCGGYTDEQLEAMKAEQRKKAVEIGMSAETFDKVFTEGARTVTERWQKMSESERSAACAEIKQMNTME